MITPLRSIILCGFLSATSQAALTSVGDIAFTSWTSNSSQPGGENFSFVTLADIDAGQSIFFDDSEWDGSALATGEGVIQWTNSTGSSIAAGTVITLSSASSNDSASPSANLGVITEPDSGFNLADIDGMFAYLGSVRNPTVFLAGIGNASSSSGLTSLTGTGLTLGVTAFDTQGRVNIEYNGARTGLASHASYLNAINGNPGSWVSNVSLTNLPTGSFNTNSFTVTPEPSSSLLLGLSGLGFILLRKRK